MRDITPYTHSGLKTTLCIPDTHPTRRPVQFHFHPTTLTTITSPSVDSDAPMTLVRTPNTNVSRRTALGTIATAGGVALGTSALLASGPEPASAALSVTDSLSVADETFESEDGTPANIFFTIAGDVHWESQDVLPDAFEVDLQLATTQADADAGAFETVGSTAGSILTYSGQARFELLGEATAHVNLDAADVAAPDAGTTTTTALYARLVGRIMQGGEVLIEATARDTGTLTVENGSVAIEHAVVGSGGIHVQRNSSDPTPTVA